MTSCGILEAIITDALLILKAHLPKGMDNGDFLLGKEQLQNVRINGDSAVGKIGALDMKFARVNNKWFIRFVME